MQKQILSTVAITFLFVSLAIAQQNQTIVCVHPQVGNIIDSTEKRVYNLFPEYRNDVYVMAKVLKNVDGSMVLKVETTKGRTVEREISQNEINQLSQQISSNTSNNDYYSKNNKQGDSKKKKNEREYSNPPNPDAAIFWTRVVIYGVFIMLDILSSR